MTTLYSDLDAKIEAFLACPAFAVLGASADRSKYGFLCFKSYLETGRKAYPVNPHSDEILGHKVYKDLFSLPEQVEAVSIITPPAVSEKLIDDAIACGIRHVWMQPGAESELCVAKCKNAGINVISGGPCLLVILGYR